MNPKNFPVSDHFDGRRFFNPGGAKAPGFRDILPWALSGRPEPWPKWVDDPPQPPPPKQAKGLAVTFLGHASFLIQIAGISLLIDPVLSRRASPFQFAGPRRVRSFAHGLQNLPAVDCLLISHDHYDHFDPAGVRSVARQFKPRAVTGLGNDHRLARCGISDVAALDWWQSIDFDGLRVTFTPGQHFSGRGLFDRNTTLWGGFMIEAGGIRVYYAGDTGDGPFFDEIARRFPAIDAAILPIGHYEPRALFRAIHMNPAEAVSAHRRLSPRMSLAKHYGTFAGLTSEAIDTPARDLTEALTAAQIDPSAFKVLGQGETIVLSA